MDKSNRIIMLMGSNRNAEENMKLAEAELRDYFPRIAFSDPVYTEPIGTNYNTPFLNRIAVAYTADRPEEIIVCFKLIEQVIGRTPNDKLIGSIPIDIDLLQWNEQILKKEDMKRDYVVSGIRSLAAE
ncbi:2-amino-4-hydroxy-6-hydroxymethyldihydropteridine diphosphokinase [Massilibacteroides vaginae]|uniref:2-amino-4-hydroxy-6- hydroxymethyldihydropteridine diphosphokinase n=1 Tax=Massilibacteroides vaginae TaxID=1673718 RepID=UPI000A1C9926|nr:2-amino-4-hydroxy-6-hydroxymethyldihydropteridine diphosphokinase [Massilibacteroides vaginae]